MNYLRAFEADLDRPLDRVGKQRLVRNLLEMRERNTDSLRLYEPMPLQRQFHESRAYIRLYLGGNRCISGDSEIDTPDGKRRVRTIKGEFPVWSWSGQKIVAAMAGKPFIKGREKMYDVRTERGTFRCTASHQILTAYGYRSLSSVASWHSPLLFAAHPRRSNSDVFPSEFRQGEVHSFRRGEDCRDGCRSGRRLCGERLPYASGNDQDVFRQPADALVPVPYSKQTDDLARKSERSRFCRWNGLLSNTDAASLRGSQPASFGIRVSSQLSESTFQNVPALRQSGSATGPLSRTIPASFQQASQCGSKWPSEATSCGVMVPILEITSVGVEDVWDFEVPVWDNYIHAGVVHHNCGKSVGTAVEFARMVRGEDPYGKYPKTNGKIYVVGKSLKHCGDTIYPLLFRPGAFRIIRDEVTDYWRTYRRWDPADRARKGESIPAPPLVPEKFIVNEGWKSRANNEPDTFTFTTGWEVVFFSAHGEHPQGSKADAVWFDEEIPASRADGPWFPEMSARLIDNNGVLFWSAAPQKGYEELYELYQRGMAQAQRHKLDPVKHPKPSIEIFQTKQEDNWHIGPEERLRFVQNLSDEERLVREKGLFTVGNRLVYPEFSLSVHGYVHEGDVPSEWTRYVFIDPGHTVCAALFVACPPSDYCPDKMPMVVAYDELYLHNCNAALFADEMKLKAEYQKFEAFVIDMHGARPTEAGSGLSVYDQYEEALREREVFSRLTGCGFLPGNSDIMAGVTRVHSWLAPRRQEGEKVFDRPSRFRVMCNGDKTVSRCPNLVWEMNRYPKLKGPTGVPIDKPNDKGPTHLCQCLRYCCMYGPEYVEHHGKVGARRTMTSYFQQLKADQGGGSVYHVSFGRSA